MSRPDTRSRGIDLRPVANAIAKIYQTYLNFDDAVDPNDGKNPLQLLRDELKKLPQKTNPKTIARLIRTKVTHIGSFEVKRFPLMRLHGYVSDIADGKANIKAYFLEQYGLRNVPTSTEKPFEAAVVSSAAVSESDEAVRARMATQARESMLPVTAVLYGRDSASTVPAVEAPITREEDVPLVPGIITRGTLPPTPSKLCVVVKSSLEENPENAIKNSLYVQSALAAQGSVSVVLLSYNIAEMKASEFSVTKNDQGNLVFEKREQVDLSDFTRDSPLLSYRPRLKEEVRRFVLDKVNAHFQIEGPLADAPIDVVNSVMWEIFSDVFDNADGKYKAHLSTVDFDSAQMKAALQKRFDQVMPLDQLILDLEARKVSYEDRIRRGKKFHFGHMFHRTEARSASGKQDAVSHILAAAICLKEGRSAAAEIRLFKECDAVKEGRLKGLFDRFNQIADRPEYRTLVTSAPTLG